MSFQVVQDEEYKSLITKRDDIEKEYSDATSTEDRREALFTELKAVNQKLMDFIIGFYESRMTKSDSRGSYKIAIQSQKKIRRDILCDDDQLLIVSQNQNGLDSNSVHSADSTSNPPTLPIESITNHNLKTVVHPPTAPQLPISSTSVPMPIHTDRHGPTPDVIDISNEDQDIQCVVPPPKPIDPNTMSTAEIEKKLTKLRCELSIFSVDRVPKRHPLNPSDPGMQRHRTPKTIQSEIDHLQRIKKEKESKLQSRLQSSLYDNMPTLDPMDNDPVDLIEDKKKEYKIFDKPSSSNGNGNNNDFEFVDTPLQRTYITRSVSATISSPKSILKSSPNYQPSTSSSMIPNKTPKSKVSRKRKKSPLSSSKSNGGVTMNRPRARSRMGNQDKVFIYCSHLKYGTQDICGIHYVRHLKDKPHMVQHKCCGFEGKKTKTITRTRNKVFDSCPVCKKGAMCIRDATVQEQQEYLKWCDSQKIDLALNPKLRVGMLLTPKSGSKIPKTESTNSVDSKSVKSVKSEGDSIINTTSTTTTTSNSNLNLISNGVSHANSKSNANSNSKSNKTPPPPLPLTMPKLDKDQDEVDGNEVDKDQESTVVEAPSSAKSERSTTSSTCTVSSTDTSTTSTTSLSSSTTSSSSSLEEGNITGDALQCEMKDMNEVERERSKTSKRSPTPKPRSPASSVPPQPAQLQWTMSSTPVVSKDDDTTDTVDGDNAETITTTTTTLEETSKKKSTMIHNAEKVVEDQNAKEQSTDTMSDERTDYGSDDAAILMNVDGIDGIGGGGGGIPNGMNGVNDAKNKDITKKVKDALSNGVSNGMAELDDAINALVRGEDPPKSRKRKREETDDRNMNEVKRVKLSRDEIEKLPFDDKVAMALGYRQQLIDKKDWCRYCGSTYSTGYQGSPWGPRKLCTRHYVAWKQSKELDLSDYPNEPLKPIDCAANNDADNLVRIIWKGQEMEVVEPPEFVA